MGNYSIKIEEEEVSLSDESYELIGQKFSIYSRYGSSNCVGGKSLLKAWIDDQEKISSMKEDLKKKEDLIGTYLEIESYWINSGDARSLFILKVLSANNYPISLNDITAKVFQDNFYILKYSDQKIRIVERLKKLITLGYATKESRGHYKITQKGIELMQIIERNKENNTRKRYY